MSFTALNTKIEALLTAQTGAGNPLDSVYQANLSANFTGYPCAVYMKSDSESDFENVAENMRTYVYHIYLIQEIENTDVDTADDILSEVADTIMDAFDDDYTLGGEALKLRAVPSIWGTMAITGGQAQFCRLSLVVDKIYQLN